MVKVVTCSADDNGEAYPSSEEYLSRCNDFLFDHHYILEYQPDDELAHVCRIAFALSGEKDLNDGAVPSPGSYHIRWRR